MALDRWVIRSLNINCLFKLLAHSNLFLNRLPSTLRSMLDFVTWNIKQEPNTFLRAAQVSELNFNANVQPRLRVACTCSWESIRERATDPTIQFP